MGELADYLVQHDSNFRKARLPALYADFRSQRTLNPDGYRANVAAWRGALSRVASAGLLSRHSSNSDILILGVDDSLLRSLENKQFGQPLAFGTVLREAIAEKDLVPVQQFLQSSQSIYQRGWSNLPWNVMGWTLRQLGITDPSRGEDKLPTGQYVIIEKLETASRELNSKLASMVSRFERVFTKAQFQRIFGSELISHQTLSETDMDILLRFLARDKDLIAYDGQVVRLRKAGEQGQITEEDAAIASIKELTANLKHQTTLLNQRIDELDREAKSAVSRKNRVAALAALKGKKLAESSLATRYGTLNQLEAVAAKLEQASDQVQLVNIMESSAGVLKSLNTQIGGADRVDGIMDQLKEQMSETDEVAAIIAESGVAVDEGEIDDELEAMEEEERQKQEEAKRKVDALREARQAAEAAKKLQELPQVPDEIIPEREKTPTTETGIADLAI